MHDIDPKQLTGGDLFTDHINCILYDDDELKTVWLIRDGDKIHIRKKWKNIGAMIEANMREANEFSRTQKLGDLVKVASIPLGIHYEWEAQGITQDDKALTRLLNDADFAKFRVNSLRV